MLWRRIWLGSSLLLSVPSVSIYTTVFGSSAVVEIIRLMEMFRMHTHREWSMIAWGLQEGKV